MKILVGVDGSEASYNAAALAAKLDIDGAAYELLAVAELPTALFATELPPAPQAIEMVLAAREQLGRDHLAEAARRLAHAGVRGAATKTSLCEGFPANELMARAATARAGVIAIGGETHGVASRALQGSVCRKLVVGAHESLLIARPGSLPSAPLRAVFATDHSQYAGRCLALLAQLAPRGLCEVTLMTAYPAGLPSLIRQMLPAYDGDVARMIEDGLEARNAEAARGLASSPWRVRTRVLAGDPHSAIEQAMTETGADLLIMGAQGHGFIERVRSGSTSLHEAVAGRHHLLILRT
jgi:nucleotide-binding universal stress UspA family protein